MTDSWGMAAIMRSEPRRQNGHVAAAICRRSNRRELSRIKAINQRTICSMQDVRFYVHMAQQGSECLLTAAQAQRRRCRYNH